MNSRFIDIRGQRLAYFQSEGNKTSTDSPAVLFVHGNSLSSRCFLGQMGSPLGRKFRLTALDLPGHGMSAPAENPAATYTMSGLGGIICQFVERVGLKDAVFVGFSFGGNLLVEAADLLPSAKGLMVIGTFLPSLPPDMPAMVFPHPALSSLFKADLTEKEIDLLAAAIMKPGAVPPPFLAEDIRKSDKLIRACLEKVITQREHKDEVSVVADLKIPLAVVVGADDQIVRESYLRSLRMPSLWRGDIQVIPDAGHIPQWEQAEKLNRLLEEFITEVAS